MVLDIIANAAEISNAISALASDVARGVVLVHGSRGSAGSGVIWNSPGLVITNHHVVPGPTAQVVLAGGRRYPARVVRRSPEHDLVALEVVAEPALLEAMARVGDSQALRAGDLVLAVGNPMAERNAATLGIAAASGAADVLRLAIDLRPGNSGGGLANARGQIVGIPHMVVGRGVAQGSFLGP